MESMEMGYGCECAAVPHCAALTCDPQSDAMLGSLSRLLLPRKERVPLECETRPLDILSKKNIGEGARLIN